MPFFRSLFAATFVIAFASSVVAQEADLAALKSGPVQSAEDTDVAYDLTVFNVGPDDAVAVTLNDPIPAGMTFVSATNDSGPAFVCGESGGIVTCTSASMPAGSTAEFTFVFHIPPGTPPGTTFTNIATVSSQIFDPNDENNSGVAVTSTPPPPQADLSIVKDGPSSAGPDTDVEYTLTVTNGGPDDASGAVWADTLPGTMTFVSLSFDGGEPMSCTTPAIGSGGTITCSAVTYPALASSTFTLTGHIPAATPPFTSFSNTATVTSDTSDPNGENGSWTTMLTVSSVDVSVVKTGPASATAGDTLSYTIVVANAGPDSATGVVLFDTIPPNTTFVSLTHDSGATAVCGTPMPDSTGTVQCIFGTLGSGVTSQYTLEIEIGNTTEVVNTATITTDSFDMDTGNNTSSVTTTVTPSSDVSIVKSGAPSVVAGTNATYTITVTNNGPSDASGVSFGDTLPANTAFVSLTQDGGPAFNCTTGATITCSITTLPVSDPATFTLVVSIDADAPDGSSIDNTANVSTTTSDPNGTNDSSTTSAAVSTSADVAVVKNGPATVTAGSNATYTIDVANNGPSDAANVSLSDTLPPNTTFVSATPGCSGTTTVTCAIGTMASGATTTITIVVAIDADAASGSSIANTANVTTTTNDPNDANDSSTTTATVATSADLTVTKSGPASVTAGTNATYTIDVTNNGPSDAANVSLSDTLPPNTTLVSATPGCSGTTTVTCTVGTLTDGASATITIVLAIDSDAPDGSSIANTAIVSATTSDPDNGNNSSTTTATVATSADVSIKKNGPATVTAGSNATYAIDVTNSGPSDAANVSLSDTLPPNTTFVSATPGCSGTTTVTCAIGTLANGATTTITIVVAVDSDAADGSSVANTATVSTTTSDANNANDSSTTTATVATSADLSVTKTGPSTINAGSNITYNVTVANGGPSDALNVVLTDTLPPDTTFVSATQQSGPPFTCITGATITCSIASFPAGASATFEFVVNVSSTATGAITNTANVSSSTTDPAPSNGSSVAAAPVVPAQPTDVSITKTANAPELLPGSEVTYTIVVRNEGTPDAFDVVVTDVLPAGTTFVSATPSQGTCAGTTTITCTIGTLAGGASATIALVVTLPSTAGPVSNTATVAMTNADPNPANNASTVVILATSRDIPTLSPLALAACLAAMALAGWIALRR